MGSRVGEWSGWVQGGGGGFAGDWGKCRGGGGSLGTGGGVS